MPALLATQQIAKLDMTSLASYNLKKPRTGLREPGWASAAGLEPVGLGTTGFCLNKSGMTKK
jgi:hypothetical protein